MRNSFESVSLERVDLGKMHEKAKNLIEESRINEEDLRGLYGEQVSSDLAEVSRLEREFKIRDSDEIAELKKVADIFEATVLDCGELNNWFGENAFTIKTSRFDDYKNGIDMIVEFRNEKPGSASYLGMAADVTFSSDTGKKFERIRRHIYNGELGRVKYFKSEHMNIEGRLSKLPEVVIGASKKTVMELAEIWVGGDNKKLATHYAQIMILRQMKDQLETFGLYAKSIGRQGLVDIYTSRLAIVDGILAQKPKVDKNMEASLDNDSVHRDILSFLNNWRASINKSASSVGQI